MNDEYIEFNFWPSFSDLMLSIVLLLVLILFLIAAVLAIGVDIEPIRYKQQKMVNAIAQAYNVKPDTIDQDFIISLSKAKSHDIIIKNDLDKQLLMFSDHVLFPPDNATLSPKGREILSVVGTTIKEQLKSLKEIQIQGHADTDPSTRFPSNLELAANRAIKVFQFFQMTVGIDPASCLMSATSFGEFKPVVRTAEDSTFNLTKLAEANKDKFFKAKNRRVEILLFYRNEKTFN